jgi:hypothetical protein
MHLRPLNRGNIHTIQKPFNKTAFSFRSIEDIQPLTKNQVSAILPAHVTRCTQDKVAVRFSEHFRDTGAAANPPQGQKHGVDFDRTDIISNICTHRPYIILKATVIHEIPP